MVENLPRLLLVSDTNLNQSGGGINRTLVNLFDSYPPELFLLYTFRETMRVLPPISQFKNRVVEFPGYYFSAVQNHFGKILNPIITATNYQLLSTLPITNQELITKFNPQVIIICPNSLSCMITGHKLVKHFNCPFLVYAMDDWIGFASPRWFSGNAQQVIAYLLQKSTAWLMISEQLKQAFAKRYKIEPHPTMIVHNPVDLTDKQVPDFTTTQEGTFKIIYAGSIWEMHYDTLAILAQAVYQLRCEGQDIELVLHTHDFFWQNHQQQWENWQVNYGGLIPYDNLNQYLQKGNLLLVVSSFLPEHKFLTRASVQTKLTDYMASGITILACGPGYSACNEFVKKWNCGLVCESNQVSVVKDFLLNKIFNHSQLGEFAHRAFKIVQENFEKQKVSGQLYNFIQQVSDCYSLT